MTRGFLRFLRGNVIGLLALFIALGGTTYAATALPKNSVGAKQLQKNAVSGREDQRTGPVQRTRRSEPTPSPAPR